MVTPVSFVPYDVAVIHDINYIEANKNLRLTGAKALRLALMGVLRTEDFKTTDVEALHKLLQSAEG